MGWNSNLQQEKKGIFFLSRSLFKVDYVRLNGKSQPFHLTYVPSMTLHQSHHKVIGGEGWAVHVQQQPSILSVYRLILETQNNIKHVSPPPHTHIFPQS